MKKNYTVASLFAGIGGIDLAFQNAGFELLWANEIDKYACQTYQQNFNHNLICDDIKNLNIKELKHADIITAGFPCQAFSIAGYQKGFHDERGSLFFDLMNIVETLKPNVLFLENVKNLVSHNNGATFKDIIQNIANNGYTVHYKIMNTADYSNIPQNRERVYIVCFKNQNVSFQFPEKTNIIRSIQDLLDKNISDDFYYNKTKYYPQLKSIVTNRETCYQIRRQYIRENKSNLCPTLTANMGTGGHNVPIVLDEKDIRKLTPRECARFQGFRDEFILPKIPNSALYKQMGNSVSVPVVEAIAQQIFLSLNNISEPI